MSYVASGITGASPIWSRIMTSLLKNTQNTLFIEPENIIEVKICGLTGTLACNACPNNRTEVFLQGTEPKKACNDDIISRILNPTQNPTAGSRDQILDGIYNEIPTDRHPTKKPKPTR
jgi:membrane carboxypeptidase/penicillin-binding protein